MANNRNRSGSVRTLSREERARRDYATAFIDMLTHDDDLEGRMAEHMQLVEIEIEEDCRDRGIRLTDAA